MRAIKIRPHRTCAANDYVVLRDGSVLPSPFLVEEEVWIGVEGEDLTDLQRKGLKALLQGLLLHNDGSVEIKLPASFALDLL